MRLPRTYNFQQGGVSVNTGFSKPIVSKAFRIPQSDTVGFNPFKQRKSADSLERSGRFNFLLVALLPVISGTSMHTHFGSDKLAAYLPYVPRKERTAN